MADRVHLQILHKGVQLWNDWRARQRRIGPDLSGADLAGMHLIGADLSETNLSDADISGAILIGSAFSGAILIKANLSKANLSGANLTETVLSGANLAGVTLANANLCKANLIDTDLTEADLPGAILTGANLTGANLTEADLSAAHLSTADLSGANLYLANMTRADLTRAVLNRANLVGTLLMQSDLTGASLDGCRIYGVATWESIFVNTQQLNLIVTPAGEPEISVDDLEMAQFLSLLLASDKLRETISTSARKAVLVLGRYSGAPQSMLLDLLNALRQRGYCPILCNCASPHNQPDAAVVGVLAQLARFVIVDITDPRCVTPVLESLVSAVPTIPVCPIFQEGGLSLSKDTLLSSPSFLPPYRYYDRTYLLAEFDNFILRPAEALADRFAENKDN